jgi:hypothetical protein
MFEQKADSHIRGNGCRLCGLESENRKFDHTWSDAQRKKIAETCQERYGAARYLDSREGKEKILQIKSEPKFREKMRNIISSDEVQLKTKQTCIDRYGVDSPMQLQEILDKNSETKRRNHTWSTSKPEEKMYLILCNKFGEFDIVRQYKDKRYPFHCDFYVKSLDLFIELNATWLHGQHWFNADDDADVNLLEYWSSKIEDGHNFYKVAIDVWTVRDVKKRQTAIDNKLNYVVFWKTDLSDFMSWIDSDLLILNNIL